MPDDIDLEKSDSRGDGAGHKRDSDGKSVDYEAKYRGLSRKYTKLEQQHEKLQEEYDESLASLERAKGEARNGSKDVLKQLKDAEAALDEANKNVNKLTKQVKVAEGDKMAAKLFAKNDVLAKMAEEGDLKSLDDFEKPEDYESYLKRMSEKFSGSIPVDKKDDKQDNKQGDNEENDEETPENFSSARRRFLAGGTPNPNPGGQGGNRMRSSQDIQDDLWNLDVNDPKYDQDYRKLEGELDLVMGVGRNNRI